MSLLLLFRPKGEEATVLPEVDLPTTLELQALSLTLAVASRTTTIGVSRNTTLDVAALERSLELQARLTSLTVGRTTTLNLASRTTTLTLD